MSRQRAALVLCIAGLVGSGCGVGDPYGHGSKPTRARAPDADAVVPVAADVGGPLAVARAFAAASTTWSWKTIDASTRRCERLATGDLRRSLQRDRLEAHADRSLRRDRLVNRGRVVAAAPAAARHGVAVVVVVRETNTAAGHEAIASRTYRVYRATLVRSRRRWLVRSWKALA